MKKLARNKVIAKGPTSAKGAQDLADGLSPDELRSLLESLMELPEEESAVELFERYLELCALGEESAEQRIVAADDLIGALDQLRIDANGGLAQAREEQREILEKLDEAVESNTISGPDLMMLGKILFDAGWTPPDTLKQAFAALLSFDGSGSLQTDGAGHELLTSLMHAADNDEFVAHAELASLLAILPTELSAQFLSSIAGLPDRTFNLALAGFALDREDSIAEAALTAQAALKGRPVESLLIERLVRMRPWMPKQRHPSLDATVRALRPTAAAPEKRQTDEVRKAILTICDAAGAQSVFLATRNGRTHSGFAILTKPEGLTDILAMRDIRKSEVDHAVSDLRESAQSFEAKLDGAVAVLQVALGANLQSGSPPPYELARLAEQLGIGDLTPRVLTTAQIIDEVIGDTHPDMVDEAATVAAHERLIADNSGESWFEAGEEIEQLLAPLKGAKRREQALLKHYLPARREYWARIFAISGFAISQTSMKWLPIYRLHFALVARDLLSVKPTESLPILQHIAAKTVAAFTHNEQFR